jgi:hypothetical protein
MTIDADDDIPFCYTQGEIQACWNNSGGILNDQHIEERSVIQFLQSNLYGIVLGHAIHKNDLHQGMRIILSHQ